MRFEVAGEQSPGGAYVGLVVKDEDPKFGKWVKTPTS